MFVWGVCVLACVRLLGGGGAVWSRRSCPGLLVCVFTLWCGRFWRVRGGVCLMGGGRPGRGRDMIVPPPTVWLRPPDACAWKRGGCSRSGEHASLL